MNIDEILTLIKAGFTKDDIVKLSTSELPTQEKEETKAEETKAEETKGIEKINDFTPFFDELKDLKNEITQIKEKSQLSAIQKSEQKQEKNIDDILEEFLKG